MEEQSKSYINEAVERVWYLPSKGKNYYHRLDGPAVEYQDGTKCWYVDDKRHRSDGPAFEGIDGSKGWWVEGKRHRQDGPAVEHEDGTKHWFVDGKRLPTKEVEDWLEENDVDLKTESGQMAFKLRWL